MPFPFLLICFISKLKANVNNIKSMCLRLRNLKRTKRPKDYYWLYIEATPLTTDGDKAGPTKYESFYTFETKPDLFRRIYESREKGIFGNALNSEFAGHDYELQLRKLSLTLNVM